MTDTKQMTASEAYQMVGEVLKLSIILSQKGGYHRGHSMNELMISHAHEALAALPALMPKPEQEIDNGKPMLSDKKLIDLIDGTWWHYAGMGGSAKQYPASKVLEQIRPYLRKPGTKTTGDLKVKGGEAAKLIASIPDNVMEHIDWDAVNKEKALIMGDVTQPGREVDAPNAGVQIPSSPASPSEIPVIIIRTTDLHTKVQAKSAPVRVQFAFYEPESVATGEISGVEVEQLAVSRIATWLYQQYDQEYDARYVPVDVWQTQAREIWELVRHYPKPEPVSVSLEKCSISAHEASPSKFTWVGCDKNEFRKIAKAVLEAAGVPYVD